MFRNKHKYMITRQYKYMITSQLERLWNDLPPPPPRLSILSTPLSLSLFCLKSYLSPGAEMC